jgi:alpha-tubulin suppressor-like RCC1 family protein
VSVGRQPINQNEFMKAKRSLILACVLGAVLLPVFTSRAQSAAKISAGDGFSLFLKGDGSLWAMGENSSGQLGDGTMDNGNYQTNLPEQITTSVMAISAGGFHSLFLKNDGSLWGMGDNEYGELGNGTTNNTESPVQVPTGGTTAISAGGFHSLFLKSDGSLWAMGYNGYGELGDGTDNNVDNPEKITNGVVAIAAGYDHSLFLKADGSLWGMGYNAYGELGDGTDNNALNPEEIATNVTAIAAGGFHSLFLKSDGSLWAMGNNAYGQLGDGTTDNAYGPEQITNGVVAIAAGYVHSLFLKGDGSLWAMGYNDYGGLGDGTLDNGNLETNRPEMIMPGGVMAISAGELHSLFLKNDGSLWGMGDSSFGQLGNDDISSYNNYPGQIYPQLVLNGGFESGDFTGWSVAGNGSNQVINTSSQGGFGGHASSFAAQLVESPYYSNIHPLDESFHPLFQNPFVSGSTNWLAQTLATQAGASYLLSFWVNGLTNGLCGVSWNGNTLVNEDFNPGWTNLQFIVTATNASSVLQFIFPPQGGIGNTATTALDDVSVTPLFPKLTAQLLSGSEMRLSLIGSFDWTYALDRTFNLTPPINWTPQMTNPVGAGGVLVFTNTPVPTTNNFWRIRPAP